MEKPKYFWIRDNKKEYGETAQPHFCVFPFSEGVEGNLIKVQEVDASLDYDQLLADARELQKGLEHYESSHYDHNKNACFADKTATEALETFTKKYGSAE